MLLLSAVFVLSKLLHGKYNYPHANELCETKCISAVVGSLATVGATGLVMAFFSVLFWFWKFSLGCAIMKLIYPFNNFF